MIQFGVDTSRLLMVISKPRQSLISVSDIYQINNRMGIDGLLRNLKQCMSEKNLEEYRGKRAAVDTYAWLHKIIKGTCGKEIITGGNALKYVNDCMRRIDKITKAGIELIMVFDGGALPGKLKEEESRKRRRQQLFIKAKDFIENGQTEQGLKSMIDSIDVSPDVAYKLIQQLQNKGIEYIVAPYEADAQLAYLSRRGIVDIIITEDSDLLAFGAKKILYKLDFTTLNGEQICLESIKNEASTGFKYFTHNMFLSACILAGCDYLEQIKGVGMKMAQKVIASNHNIKKSLPVIGATKQIPDGYEQKFIRAFLTFRFQRVYCPLEQRCVSVNELNPLKIRQMKADVEAAKLWSEEVLDLGALEFAQRLSLHEDHEDWQFLGRKLTKQTAIQIAEARINPITFQPYDEDCLKGLRYNKVMGFQSKPISKKSSHSAPDKTSNKSIKDFISVDKKNVLEYRSIKAGEINRQDYVVPILEDNDSITSNFHVREIKNKKSLRFNDKDSDSDDDVEELQEEVSKVESIDLISDSQDAQQSGDVNISQLSIKSDKQTTNFRNKLQEISETYFSQIFSAEFLNAPFS